MGQLLWKLLLLRDAMRPSPQCHGTLPATPNSSVQGYLPKSASSSLKLSRRLSSWKAVFSSSKTIASLELEFCWSGNNAHLPSQWGLLAGAWNLERPPHQGSASLIPRPGDWEQLDQPWGQSGQEHPMPEEVWTSPLPWSSESPLGLSWALNEAWFRRSRSRRVWPQNQGQGTGMHKARIYSHWGSNSPPDSPVAPWGQSYVFFPLETPNLVQNLAHWRC